LIDLLELIVSMCHCGVGLYGLTGSGCGQGQVWGCFVRCDEL